MRHLSICVSSLSALTLLLACGGKSDDKKSNKPPQPVIASPAEGTLYKGGDTIAVAVSATDPEDGTVPASKLTWWAEFHHDTHTHPFQPETSGASGSVTIPTQGETADNVWYRFHLRATDSAGVSTEITRDVFPRKVQLTLQSSPTGLKLNLDGQPQTAPAVITGVVGIQRELGAPSPQNLSGRKYTFTSWSDSGAATHNVSTPPANATYTATFTDAGPANQPPTCALVSPPSAATVGTAIVLNATATDSDGTIAKVEFFDGATMIGVADTTAPYSVNWTPATPGSHSITAKATDDGGASTTSAAASVTVTGGGADTQPPTCTLTAPANFASGLTGALNVTANATDNVGVVGVQFQIDGENLGAEDTSAPYEAALGNTNLYTNGQHILRARARDAAGNLSPWATAIASFGDSVDVPQGFTRNSTWITGLDSATAMTFAPDGRLFVCQQGGALRVIKNNALLSAAFLTLSVDNSGERGLLGVAFDPAFASNQFIYVYYTVPAGTGVVAHNRISRFTANGDGVLTNSELILQDLPNLTSATNHNGGAMHFGPDGKLYVAVGENATPSNAQSDSNVLGKMLRFNSDGTIPTDNPFYATNTGQARAIWAKGLRNPFTFAFQPGTSRMHINDVGQNTWEEVNLGAAGANFGWPTTEGDFDQASFPQFTRPIFSYKHSGAGSATGSFFQGFAIIGGAFYPSSGGTFPSVYQSNYFFADYVSNWVARMDLANGNAVYSFARLSHSPVDLAVGSDGSVYVLGRSQITRISKP
jgi:glucose/arabinose dehydrogenase